MSQSIQRTRERTLEYIERFTDPLWMAAYLLPPSCWRRIPGHADEELPDYDRMMNFLQRLADRLEVKVDSFYIYPGYDKEYICFPVYLSWDKTKKASAEVLDRCRAVFKNPPGSFPLEFLDKRFVD